MQQVMQAFSDKSPVVDSSSQQYHSINSAGTFVSSSAFSVSTSDNMCDWIVDTGVSDHMTSHMSLMTDVHTLHKPVLVALPDGTIKVVHTVGTVVLPDFISLQHVLYVPDFKQNLLSVGRLIENGNVSVVFLKSQCLFQDLSGSEMLATAKRSGALYIYTSAPVFDNKTLRTRTLCSVSCNNVFDVHLLHARLGHTSLDKLKHISCIPLKEMKDFFFL
ncbi:hypothetical protein RND81_11G142700 [Saponaria officinalis]|uniref:Retrovirus-related Pol polyprotein from transposon TNT 1-94-like beta-barrel domain-containing protein n=1 Tax=Saponaria officinalis TaxID=3572 RepID=A0AAW1HNN2_SAPOF